MSKKKKKKALKAEREEQKKKAKARYRSQQWFSWGLVGLLSLVAVILSLFWIPGEIHYMITETYTFTAAESTKVYLSVLLPTSGNYQEVLTPEITWPGSWTTEPVERMEFVRFETDLAAGETAEAVIQYQVNLSQGEAQWSGKPAIADDLVASEVIQSDFPEIIDQAAQLTATKDDLGSAFEIFNFTRQYLMMDEDSADTGLSVLDVYHAGSGGSTEHANLMTALCRAADLPAHIVNGLVLPEALPFISVSFVREQRPQDWVEVLTGDQWQMADPSLAKRSFQRSLFGWTDGKHLVYGTASEMTQVSQAFASELGESGIKIGEASGPMHFTAWAEVPVDNITFTPAVTLRKTWDARYLMAFSVITILAVINWLLQQDRKRTRDRRAASKK